MTFLRTDSQAEWNFLEKASLESGAFCAVICKHWAQGGAGILELADAVIEHATNLQNSGAIYW
jgi:methylenetetrahydrofolate dehydrogenase (NADP+)/methenyltetrahydrofolate cyclohydrolase/formyltetrahydrofolate synthetase